MALDFNCSENINSTTRVDFKSLVESVMDHAPSDASCEAFLYHNSEGPYRASVKIHSMDVEIKSRQSCDSAEALLHSMKNDLYQQIRDWRSNRVLGENENRVS